MRSFRHIAPSLRLFEGENSLDRLPDELDRLGVKRAVVVCGSTLARTGSPLDLVTASAGARCAGVYARVTAQSPLDAVMDAAAALARLKADAVIAVGGGSAIVTARAASILLAEGKDAHALCTAPDATGALRSPKLAAPKLPQLVVPTTPTTATIKAGSAVLDPLTRERLALYDPKTRAAAVFVHPALIASAPRSLHLAAGLNTLTLAVEGLLSHAGDPISDALLIHAVRTLVAALPELMRTDAIEVRAQLMDASILCGHGSDYTGAGMALPIGHAIGTRFALDNGLADAIVLPHVLRFNAPACESGLAKIAVALGLASGEGDETTSAVVARLETLLESLGVARRLRDVGVTRESLREIAVACFDDWYLRSNPRRVADVDELRRFLEAAW